MKKHLSLFFIFIVSIGFSLDVYSGGKLSKNQAAIDVTHYDLRLKVDPYKKTIAGTVQITFMLIAKTDEIEIDLLDQFHVSGTAINGMNLSFKHEGHKILIDNPELELFKSHSLDIKYSGKPPVAKNRPGMGDSLGKKVRMVTPGLQSRARQMVPISGIPAKSTPAINRMVSTFLLLCQTP